MRMPALGDDVVVKARKSRRFGHSSSCSLLAPRRKSESGNLGPNKTEEIYPLPIEMKVRMLEVEVDQGGCLFSVELDAVIYAVVASVSTAVSHVWLLVACA